MEHSGACTAFSSFSPFFFVLYLQGITNTEQFLFCLTSFGDGPKTVSKQIIKSFFSKEEYFLLFPSNRCLHSTSSLSFPILAPCYGKNHPGPLSSCFNVSRVGILSTAVTSLQS